MPKTTLQRRAEALKKISDFFKSAWNKTKDGVSAFFKMLSELHVTKRASMPIWKSLLVRVIAVVIAVIFCSLLSIFMIGANPIKFIGTMFKGTFANAGTLWRFAKNTATLLCISVAVTPAFKMRFWNIGAEGQTLVGALASVAVIHYLGGKVPNALLLIFMLLASLLAGAVWGGIPAIFKAKWNTNETLFTLMMNYIATGIVACFVVLWATGGSNIIERLVHGHMPIIVHENFIPVVLVLVVTGLAYVYLKYSKQGYEISVVGESENTAKYIGISVGKVIIRTMIISGALCGFVGFIIVSAFDHTINVGIVGGLGFTAIMASWLAKFNPLIMIGTSAFIMFLDQGSSEITSVFNIDSSFPDIVVGIVLFFIIGCEFFINYSIKRKETKKEVTANDSVS